MNIAIRVDASDHIGSGHVMRCLTLADELRHHGVGISFFCQELEGHMAGEIERRGFDVALHSIPESKLDGNQVNSQSDSPFETPWQSDAAGVISNLKGRQLSWLIVDHYGLDKSWQTAMRPYCKKVMVIDDLANRAFDCDILLDQTHGRRPEAYGYLRPQRCRLLLGAQYALVRPEFSALRSAATDKRKDYAGLKNILVFMGGSDKSNLTGSILSILACIEWEEEPVITVVVGVQSPHFKGITDQATTHPLTVKIMRDVPDMAALMLTADLAIGAAGTTSWERCALGLPALINVMAPNQESNAKALSDVGAVYIWQTVDELQEQLQNMDTTGWARMSAAAEKVCDGRGCHRVVRAIYEAGG